MPNLEWRQLDHGGTMWDGLVGGVPRYMLVCRSNFWLVGWLEHEECPRPTPWPTEKGIEFKYHSLGGSSTREDAEVTAREHLRMVDGQVGGNNA